MINGRAKRRGVWCFRCLPHYKQQQQLVMRSGSYGWLFEFITEIAGIHGSNVLPYALALPCVFDTVRIAVRCILSQDQSSIPCFVAGRVPRRDERNQRSEWRRQHGVICWSRCSFISQMHSLRSLYAHFLTVRPTAPSRSICQLIACNRAFLFCWLQPDRKQ